MTGGRQERPYDVSPIFEPNHTEPPPKVTTKTKCAHTIMTHSDVADA